MSWQNITANYHEGTQALRASYFALGGFLVKLIIFLIDKDMCTEVSSTSLTL